MKKSFLIFLFGIFSMAAAVAQTAVKGSVIDGASDEPIPGVTITIEGTDLTTQTDAKGEFSFTADVPLGEQVLVVEKIGYVTKRYPIVVNEGKTVDIRDMSLDIDVSNTQDLFTVTLTDDELNDDTGGADNISGLLQSSQDIFQRTAAFEFSSSFFNVRGLDSENGTVLMNGIEMNKEYDGRPQWSDWGGLNDVVRNQELTNGLAPSAYTFGGVLGTTNIITRASQYRAGGRLTYSSSNRSYTNRLIATYASGLISDGWAFTVSIGRRWGNEGYQDATLYDANSFFASVEKKINEKHSINFTSIYSPNRRGKSSPNTQEVYDLKGIKYNEYWGYFDGEKRNSRIKEVEEPILMLNHYWDISSKTTLNTNIGYQFGKIGNSRLDYNGTDLVNGFPEGGGSNPSPTYYQKLPSYFVRNNPENLSFAYMAEQEFLNDGQIDWYHLYDANISNAQGGGNAIYALYEDRTDDKKWTFNSIFNTEFNENIQFNASVNYTKLKSSNFANVLDLLGASTYLDVDSFGTNTTNVQSDLQNPNRIVTVGDKFKYNYNLYSNVLNGYASALFKYNKIDFYLAADVTKTEYQREGIYQNGSFPDNSLGKGRKLDFTGFGGKAGFTYKLTGKHLFDVNAAYITKAPSLRNTYSNSRENHNIVGDQIGREISEEKLSTVDASYIFRSPIVKAKLTGYYTKIENANEISFYYADGIGGSTTAFIQEILQGINKKHIGGEFGIEAQVTPTIKLKGVASVGQYTYDNNPDLTLTFEPSTDPADQAVLGDAGFI
ncbi:MAG: TonB-dependent receptor, partial [Gelidibacter sp.]